MKFQAFKNAKFIPGFIHPPDQNGISMAQWILPSGYPSSSNKKKKYFEFNDNLPDDEKEPTQKSALKKFNKKFSFNFK